MKAFRLAIVRQKYRPDGGAERFVSRALEALEQQDLDLNVITREWQGDANPNWHIHLCNPLKLGRISRERGFAVAARTPWPSWMMKGSSPSSWRRSAGGNSGEGRNAGGRSVGETIEGRTSRGNRMREGTIAGRRIGG